MLQPSSTWTFKRYEQFGHPPPATSQPRVLLVVTTEHDDGRIQTYVNALRKYSGVAVDVIKPTDDFLNLFPKKDNLAQHDFTKLLKTYDGFVLSGGKPNVTPELYREKAEYDDSLHDLPRDLLSIGVLQQASPATPILGICLGMQHIAVAHGAKLKKVDDHGPKDDANKYAATDPLQITNGSLLHAIQPTAGEIFGRSRLA